VDEVTRHEILIVDDDDNLCDTLSAVLESAGFAAQCAADGATMMAKLARGAFSLVLIDLRLQNEDGMQLARELRQRSRIPIIMVTGQGDDTDRVLGLETAVDDFVMKPFNNRELVARIRALLRRSTEVGMPRSTRADPVGHARYRFDRWVVNLSTRTLSHVDGSRCELTQGEFALLEALVLSPNRVISREQLLTMTRGADSATTDRTIDVLILRLRKKLELNPALPTLIRTERGLGYRFAADVVRC
jgi:two-component system OmpR family response regulator